MLSYFTEISQNLSEKIGEHVRRNLHMKSFDAPSFAGAEGRQLQDGDDV